MGYPTRPSTQSSAAQRTDNTVYNKQYAGSSRSDAQRISQETGVPLGTVRTGAGKAARTQYVVGISSSADPVGHAFMSVHGRMPNARERASYQQFVKTGRKGGDETNHSSLRMHIAANYNVRDKEKWGVTAADPSQLKGNMKERYDLWRQYNPDEEFTTATLQYLGWSLNGGRSDVTFEAEQRGLIRTELEPNGDGTYQAITYISPEATAFAASRGEQIFINGTQRGRLYFGDLGNVRTANLQFNETPTANGMYYAVGKGRPKKGWIGGEVGKFFTEKVSGQLKWLLDPLGVYTPLLFGQKYGEDLLRGGAQLTGADTEDIARVQQIGQQALSVAVNFIPGVGPALGAVIGAGIQTLGAQSTATTFGLSRTEAFGSSLESSVVSIMAAGIAQGFQQGNLGSSAYQNAAANAYDEAIAAGKTVAQAQKIAAAAGQAAIPWATRLVQNAISGAVSGGLTSVMERGEGASVTDAIFAGALSGAVGNLATSFASMGLNSVFDALSQTDTASFLQLGEGSRVLSGFSEALSASASSYIRNEVRYSMDSNYRDAINQAIAFEASQGRSVSRQDIFEREALSAAFGGLYSGARSGEIGQTLGEFFNIDLDSDRPVIGQLLDSALYDTNELNLLGENFAEWKAAVRPDIYNKTVMEDYFGSILDTGNLVAGMLGVPSWVDANEVSADGEVVPSTPFSVAMNVYAPVSDHFTKAADYLDENTLTFRELLFGQDEEFNFSDLFSSESGERGLADAFIEASLTAIGGGFAAGLLDPREGPVTFSPTPIDPMGSDYVQLNYQDIDSGGGGDGGGYTPEGSTALAEVVGRGGLGIAVV